MTSVCASVPGSVAANFKQHEQYAALLAAATSFLGAVDVVLIAHGDLPDQHRAERDVAYALDEIDVNGLSVVALLTAVANLFERLGHGTIVVISSVAGDRGRRSNYVYGSAKALVSTFMSGLRQRLEPKGVHVITVKPGPIVSPMTAHLSPGRMWGKPEAGSPRHQPSDRVEASDGLYASGLACGDDCHTTHSRIRLQQAQALGSVVW